MWISPGPSRFVNTAGRDPDFADRLDSSSQTTERAHRTMPSRGFIRRIVRAAVVIAVLSRIALALPAVITSVREMQELSNWEASHELPVEFEASVTYSRGYQHLLFPQDGHYSVFVRPPSNAQWLPGDRVRIVGITRPSLRPIVVASASPLLDTDSCQLPLPQALTN